MADEANRTVSPFYSHPSLSTCQSFSLLASWFLLYMTREIDKKNSFEDRSWQLFEAYNLFWFGQKEQAFIELQGRMIETTSKFKQVTWI